MRHALRHGHNDRAGELCENLEGLTRARTGLPFSLPRLVGSVLWGLPPGLTSDEILHQADHELAMVDPRISLVASQQALQAWRVALQSRALADLEHASAFDDLFIAAYARRVAESAKRDAEEYLDVLLRSFAIYPTGGVAATISKTMFLEQQKSAARLWLRVAESLGVDAYQLHCIGRWLIERAHPDIAQAFLELTASLDSHASTWLLLSECEAEPTKKLELLKTAYESNPGMDRAACRYAEQLAAIGQVADAKRVVEDVLSRNRDYGPARRLLERIHTRQA